MQKLSHVISYVTIFSMHTYCFTDRLYSKVTKTASRHKIASISAEGYISQQSSIPEEPKRTFFLRVETPGGLLTWL